MALAAGTVLISVSDVGNISYVGSGLALALAQAEIAAKVMPTVPTIGQTSSPYAVSFPASQTDVTAAVTIIEAIADDVQRRANAYAMALIAYFVANAVVNAGTLQANVTSQSLGRTPNPNNANTPIVAPSSPVTVPLTGAGTIS